MIDILVGAPSWKREWILEEWFFHVEMASSVADVVPSYTLLLDARETESADLIDTLCKQRDRYFTPVWVNEKDIERKGRQHWNYDRYVHMAWLRNMLLERVRRLEPSYFLSLDTDILLHHGAIQNMLETIQEFDAVATKTFLSPAGTKSPNYAMMPNAGQMMREDFSGVLEVDAIMAAKLMTPQVYAVDYEPHEQGEDIGFSLACRRKGLRLGWDGRVCSKHVMDPISLNRIDQRAGY